ncbi:MAG: phosphatidylglycerol lysyltransferase domain-containing protein [Muribaculaceae bacterium]|nr:phosphatidylglycerol lysyltransferase domain-containing protein [Muribaculaceae bacterium]
MTSPLKFKRIMLEDMLIISNFLEKSASRTCDYTVGGIYMWVHYFNYRYCIYRNTLFIEGVSEEDMSRPAFSMPLGELPLAEGIELLRGYCADNGYTLRFSAIPEDRIDEFRAVGNWTIEPLPDWADYMYEAEAMATLSGKKLSKKRNHVNRFMLDNPDARLIPLRPENVDKVLEAFYRWDDEEGLQSLTAMEERDMTVNVLRHLDKLPGFEGAYLDDGRGNIVAFTVGEVIGDTLYDHIEKMDHSVSGAGTAVFHLYVKAMMEKYPGLCYVNREEDVGDEGLRKAKQSYHPSALLQKYDIIAR